MFEGQADLAADRRPVDVVPGKQRPRLAERSPGARQQAIRELAHVGRRRAQRAGAGNRLEGPLVRGLRAVPGLGEARPLLGGRILHRVDHAERAGDLLAHQHRPRFAVSLLDHDAEHSERQVRVLRRARRLTAMGRELGAGEVLEQRLVVVLGVRIGGVGVHHVVRQPRQAGGVRRELLERHGAGRGVIEPHRQALRERIVELEPALDDGIGKQQAGEDFRDRADLEQHLLGSDCGMPGRERLAGERELPPPAALLGRRDGAAPERRREARRLASERRRLGGLRRRAHEHEEEEVSKSSHGRSSVRAFRAWWCRRALTAWRRSARGRRGPRSG